MHLKNVAVPQPNYLKINTTVVRIKRIEQLQMSSEVAIDKLKERFGDKMPTILLDGDYMVTSFTYKTHFYKDIYHDNKVKFFIRK